MSEYVLSPDCISVSGYNKSIIMDLSRQDYYEYWSEVDFLKNSVILDKLKKEELVLEKDTYTNVKALSHDYERPSIIDICIIEYLPDVDVVVNCIQKFGISAVGLLINSDEHFSKEELHNFLTKLESCAIERVEIYFESSKVNEEDIYLFSNLSLEHPFLNTTFFFNEIDINIKSTSVYNQVKFIKSSFNKNLIPQQDNFIIDFGLYSDSLLNNASFFKKIFISKNGNFYESPHKKLLIGNSIENFQLDKLNEIWKATKNVFDVCKDCEFRHMCVDNRMPHQRSDKKWYHEIECNYNPYISKWKGEKGYLSLAECGVISNEHEFSIDHERIAEINKKLWDE